MLEQLSVFVHFCISSNNSVSSFSMLELLLLNLMCEACMHSSV